MKKLLTILTSILLGVNLAYGLVTVKTNSVALTLADTCDGTFNDFKFQLAGYNYNEFKFSYDVSLTGVDCVFRITKPIEGTIYLDIATSEITVSTTNVTFAIAQTNLPPPGNYYGELLSYQTGTTNYYRSLAQGKLPITWSLYLNETNYFQRSTTNAVVGQIYVHPSWVYPTWGSTNMVNSLSNYVVYMDGVLQTNINIASNKLNLIDGVLQTNINTLSNYVGVTYAKQVDYQATSNDLDTAEALLVTHTSQIGAISNDIDEVQGQTNAFIQAVANASAATNFLGTNTIGAQIAANTNNIFITSNAFVAADTVLKADVTNRITLSSNYFDTVRTDLTNRIELTSNAFVVADATLRSELTNTITVGSNYFENVKVATGDVTYTTTVALAASALQAESDPAFTNWLNTNTYVQSESDPVYAASVAAGIVAADTNRWNAGATNASAATNDIATINAARGATNITAGAANSYDLATRTLTWNTNAASGSGSGFPLTADGDLAGYSLTNGAFVGNGAGVSNINATNATSLGAIPAASYARKDLTVEYFTNGVMINSSLAIGTNLNQPVGSGSLNMGGRNNSDSRMDANANGAINAGLLDGSSGTRKSYMFANGIGSMNRGGIFSGDSTISNVFMQADGIGAMNMGYLFNTGKMYASGDGSLNIGYAGGILITNSGNGSIALCDDSGNITITNNASIVLGNGTSLEDRSILADVVRARVNFIGNGAGLTNLPIGVTNNQTTVSFDNLAVTNLQITGGSPTNESVLMSTNNLGQTGWVTSRYKLISSLSQTTNTTSLVITGVGFKPVGAVVFANMEGKKTDSQGFIDSAGNDQCMVRTESDAHTVISSASFLQDSTGKNIYLNWVSWDADGATFTRTPDAGIITNNINYKFLLYR